MKRLRTRARDGLIFRGPVWRATGARKPSQKPLQISKFPHPFEFAVIAARIAEASYLTSQSPQRRSTQYGECSMWSLPSRSLATATAALAAVLLVASTSSKDVRAQSD